MEGVSFGNSELNPLERKGWIVGRYIEEDPNRKTEAVEVKWGIHPAGQKNEKFAANKTATTISIILSGRFRLMFKQEEKTLTIVLKSKGDYPIWAPGVYHDWEAETDCEILTVRWPSAANDQIALQAPKSETPAATA